MLAFATRQTSNAAQQISFSTQPQKTAGNRLAIALRKIANSGADTTQSIARISGVRHEMAELFSLLHSEVGRFTLTDKAWQCVKSGPRQGLNKAIWSKFYINCYIND